MAQTTTWRYYFTSSGKTKIRIVMCEDKNNVSGTVLPKTGEQITESELRKFFVEQRDKQLGQLMETNGKATFAILAIFGALFIGSLSLEDSEVLKGKNCILLFIGFTFILLGIGCLFYSAAKYSFFHSDKIRTFEKLIKNASRDDFDKLTNKDFQILPQPHVNYFVAIGLALLLLGALFFVLTVLISQ